MHPDWDRYRADFPNRYWNTGVFDDTLRSFLRQQAPAKIVDIGGGAFGTEVLKEAHCPVFLLDPYVSTLPSWMSGRMNWGDHLHFDLAVARGSINYFTDTQFSQLRGMLRSKGRVIANTFLTAPSVQWRKRTVVNGAGEEGSEWVRLHNNRVEHVLEYSSRRIEHHFYFRSQDEFDRLLPGCRFIQHGENSFTLFWEAP